MIEESWLGSTKQDKHITATQINITLSPGTGSDMSNFAQSIPIEAEVKEIDEDDDDE